MSAWSAVFWDKIQFILTGAYNILKKPAAIIFRMEEDEGRRIIRNVGNYLPDYRDPRKS
jgi:hypothetical protein